MADRIWRHPSVVLLRADSGLEDQIVAPLRAMADRIESATLGLGPSVSESLLGEDSLVALYGDDVLLISRLSAGGRVMDVAGAIWRERLMEAGLRMEGDTAVLERDGAAPVYLTRYRDVLAIATRRGLAESIVVIGEQSEEFPSGPGMLADLGEPGRRVLVRGDPALLAGWMGAAAGDGDGDDDGAEPHAALALLRDLSAPAGARPSTVVVDFTSPTRVRVELHGVYADAWPDVLASLPATSSDAATRLRNVAGVLALPSETVVTGGLSVRAVDAIRTLADAQPTSRRALLDDLLAERGVTLEIVAASIAAHLEDGLGFVVARLDEADALELDDPREGGVHPIPATLVIFELKDGADPDAAVAAVIAESETLFGAKIEFSGRELPDGVELFRLSAHRFGGEWELLRPAVAVAGGHLLFCTHEEFLVRALANTSASALASESFTLRGSVGSGPREIAARRAPPTASTLDLVLTGDTLRRYIDDQRWAWATQATYHDWRVEREAIRRELDRKGSILRPEDRRIYEDTRIEQRLARRNAEEFPVALAAYRERWAPLDVLGTVELQLSVDRQGLQLRLDVQLSD